MGLKFRRGSTAQQSGSLAFGEPYVNTTLGTLVVGGATGDIILSSTGTGSTGNFGAISGSGLDITGNANIAGNLTLGGQLTIGDQTSDTVNVVASLSSSLIPQTTNAFDLGSQTKFWRDLYISTGSIKMVNPATNQVVTTINAVPGGGIQIGNVQISTASISFVDNSGNITQNIAQSSSAGSTSNYTITSSFQSYTGSQDTKNSNLATISGSLISTASANVVAISNLNTTTASLNTSVLSLNTFSGSQLTQNTALATISGSLISTASANVVAISNLNTFSGSQLTQNTALATISGSLISSASTAKTTNDSQDISISNLNSFSGSQLTQNTALATITGSLITSASSLTQRVAANEAVSGTFARTNSANTLTGNQIISGSLRVTQDLIVLGSSSIQNISSSNLVIGAAYVTLNTFSPSSRYAGLNIIDSGSNGGSGSLWYDAVQDEFIQVHKGNGINVTSSHFVQGPQTYDDLGNELYLTNNRLTKGTGLEHIVDSNITDTGTLITLGSNTYVNGTFYATGTVLVSGSAQVIALLPTGVVSGSSQTITNLPTGTVSGSAQVLGGTGIHSGSITNYLPTGTISGSSQVDATATTNWSTGIKTVLNSNTVVSGSSQITYANISSIPSGIVSGSAQVTPLLPTGTVSGSSQITYTSISSIPGGIVSGSSQVISLLPLNTVSGSSQVTLSSTTGYSTTINQNLLTTSDVRHNSLGIGMAASATSGRIDAAGDIVAYSTSDKNFKENITPIPNALEKISKISGNTYDWKADMKEFHGFEGNDVGVIAQEIEEVLPQLVTTRETGYKAVKYDKLVALLIEGIKEQQTQIHSLTIEIEKLKESKGL